MFRKLNITLYHKNICTFTCRVKKILDSYSTIILEMTSINRTRTNELANQAAAEIFKQIENNNEIKKGSKSATNRQRPPPPSSSSCSSASNFTSSNVQNNTDQDELEENNFDELFKTNEEAMDTNYNDDDDLNELFEKEIENNVGNSSTNSNTNSDSNSDDDFY